MPYIGKQPLTGAYQLCDTITTSATATYNLLVGGSAVIPGSAQNCIVSLNGVIQAPVNAFTVSGSQITFASALTSSDVIDFILILGNVFDIGTPTNGAVTNSSLNSNVITGQTAETTIDGADSVLIYDDSATALRKMTRTNFVSGLNNTPYFYIRRGSEQNIPNGTETVILYDDKVVDSNSLYNTTNGRFTVTASTTGYYFFSASYRANNWTSARQYIQIKKNGSGIIDGEDGNSGNYTFVSANAIINLANSGDYIEIVAYQDSGVTKPILGANTLGNFFGFKIIT